MTKKEITEEVNRLIPCTRFLKKSRGTDLYNCPFCGSGTGKHKTGALQYYPATNTCFCRGNCGGKKYTAIDLYMNETGADFETARDTLAEELGLDNGGKKETAAERRAREEKQRKYKEKREKELAEAQARAEEEAKKAANYDFTAYYKACRARLDDPEALAYLNGRGISKETAYNCFIGYDPEADPAGAPGAMGNEYRPHPCKRIIAPTTKKHYIGRSIQTDTAGKYVKMNPTGASPGIFNKSRLAADVPEVFVTEGFFDALSVEEVGAAAVSLNSTSNTEILLKAIRETPTGATLVLCLDNDAAGENKTKPLQEGLQALGVHCICANIAGSYNDPNEALQKDKEAFIKAVKEAQEQARAYRKEAEEMTGEQTAPQMQTAQELQEVERAQEVQEPQEKGEAAADQRAEAPKKTAEELAAEYRASWRKDAETRGNAFLQAITTEKYKPVPTGIYSLDKALGGGFMRQWLVTLGAPPGAGKTALAQWIFEHMAIDGHTVLYFNAEMSREQLIARSLAKIIKKKYHADMEIPQILQGYKWSDSQRPKVEAAIKKYTEKIAPFICYNPEPKGKTDATNPAEIHQIIKLAQAEAERATAAGLNAPILVIDYLQLIEAEGQDDKTEIIKTALRLLKGYAIKYNTIVFVITAHKRDGGEASTMESGRDTSNIEYSADLLLALDYTACLPSKDRKPKKFTELSQQERRKKTLVIHKARFSEAPQQIDLLFDGRGMDFEEIGDAGGASWLDKLDEDESGFIVPTEEQAAEMLPEDFKEPAETYTQLDIFGNPLK